MNIFILNRNFKHPDDGWYHIEAKGEHANCAAGVVQIVDDTACREIVNRFNAEAGAAGFAGMLIDHEHFKHDLRQETIAYGWLTQLAARADGIYGQIRWTDTGKKAVDGGDYRFFSTEYAATDVAVLNRVGELERVRPLRLSGLTLTNVNNNKGQKPITNRGVAQDPPQKAKHMKTVCTLLGLSADASEEAIHAEVARALNRAKELEHSQIDSDLETYKNRFDAKQKEFIRSLLVTNRAATLDFLKLQPELHAPTAPARLHNRQAAQGIDVPAGTPDEAALSAERTAAIQQYKITNRCSFQEAHDAIRRKKPALFGIRN